MIQFFSQEITVKKIESDYVSTGIQKVISSHFDQLSRV